MEYNPDIDLPSIQREHWLKCDWDKKWKQHEKSKTNFYQYTLFMKEKIQTLPGIKPSKYMGCFISEKEISCKCEALKLILDNNTMWQSLHMWHVLHICISTSQNV